MKTNSKKVQSGVKVLSNVKGGGIWGPNSNRTMLAIKSGLKAGDGILAANHNRRGIAVKSGLKAGDGILAANHNRRIA